MMNPSSAGWIKKFFSVTGDLNEHKLTFDLELPPEEFIYGNLQPSGLMYGFPNNFVFLPESESEKWSGAEKFKVLLFEGLLIADCAHNGRFEQEDLEKTLERFVEFYEVTEIEKAKKKWYNFSEQDVYGKLESILHARIDIKISLSNPLWTNYLHNSLVFQDLILYYEYIHGNHPEDVKAKRQAVMLDMMKVVAVAAHADGEIADEEEALFDIFMASSRLAGDERDIAKAFWDESRTLEDVELNYKMSWLLKRYFLEIGILVVWSDKIVVPSEELFLDELSALLEFEEEEQDKSFIAIQTFVMQNAEQIPFMTGKNEAEQLMSGALDKWKKILSRNKDKIGVELKQNKELVQLIRKSTSTDLSKEEKKKVKSQFKDMARSVPSLAIFLLPGGTLILPLVLKLIPDLIPSAFRSNQVDESSESSE